MTLCADVTPDMIVAADAIIFPQRSHLKFVIFLKGTQYEELKKDAPRQNAAHNSARAANSVVTLKVTPCKCHFPNIHQNLYCSMMNPKISHTC